MAKYAHKLVSKTAQEIAAAFYQDAAMDNNFYKMWPKEREFVNKQWGNFIRPARETLTKMLSMDKFSEEVKADIYEALLLDRALPPKGDTALLTPHKSMVH
jgi:hypothetical protein